MGRIEIYKHFLTIQNFNDLYAIFFRFELIKELILYDLMSCRAKQTKERVISIFAADFDLFKSVLLLGSVEFRKLLFIYLGPDIFKVTNRPKLSKEIFSISQPTHELFVHNILPAENRQNALDIFYRLLPGEINKILRQDISSESKILEISEYAIDSKSLNDICTLLNRSQQRQLLSIVQRDKFISRFFSRTSCYNEKPMDELKKDLKL